MYGVYARILSVWRLNAWLLRRLLGGIVKMFAPIIGTFSHISAVFKFHLIKLMNFHYGSHTMIRNENPMMHQFDGQNHKTHDFACVISLKRRRR